MENPFNGKLFTGGQSRTQRTVSLPSEVDGVLGRRLKVLGMTFQEYVASLVSYDLWAEKPHALTGDACKGHKRSKAAKADEGRLWAEIIASYGKPNKTGSYFEHHLNRVRGVESSGAASILDQIAVIEDQIRSLRESHAGPDGTIDDAKAARDVECMEATAELLRASKKNARL